MAAHEETSGKKKQLEELKSEVGLEALIADLDKIINSGEPDAVTMLKAMIARVNAAKKGG